MATKPVWVLVGVCAACAVTAEPLSAQRLDALGARYGVDTLREYRLLERERTEQPRTHTGIFDEAARRGQAFHPQATILPADRDPLDIVLRRTRALFQDLARQVDLAPLGERLAALEQSAARVQPDEQEARIELLQRLFVLRREIAFANPLLASISKILFITREALPTDEYHWGVHMCDQYFGFHATLHGTTQGNGLYALEAPWSAQPRARNLLAESTVASGPRRGERLDNGGFLAPDVSYDGRQNRRLHMESLAAPRSLIKNPLVCAGLLRALALEQTIFAQRVSAVTRAKRVEALR